MSREEGLKEISWGFFGLEKRRVYRVTMRKQVKNCYRVKRDQFFSLSMAGMRMN